MPDGVELRCSAIVVRRRAVLLVHRIGRGADDWVLPGGTPRSGESMAACARREVREETGLNVNPDKVAFVLEAGGPDSGLRTVDIVFSAVDPGPDQMPEQRERGLAPVFVPVDRIQELDLRPPVAGHLRAMLDRRRELYAPYLANLWRPARGRAQP